MAVPYESNTAPPLAKVLQERDPEAFEDFWRRPTWMSAPDRRTALDALTRYYGRKAFVTLIQAQCRAFNISFADSELLAIHRMPLRIRHTRWPLPLSVFEHWLQAHWMVRAQADPECLFDGPVPEVDEEPAKVRPKAEVEELPAPAAPETRTLEELLRGGGA